MTEEKEILTFNATAYALAADFAGSEIDPNEAQKALAFLRSTRNPQQFFAYLRAITRDGRIVIRSGRTLTYYREMLAACERHLSGMEDADEMLHTLGWSIRLLRYYRAVPDADTITSSSAAPAKPTPRTSAPEQQTPPREAVAPMSREQLAEEIKAQSRTLGIVVQEVTPDAPGTIEDGEGQKYRYLAEDVSDEPPRLHERVWFTRTKKKIEVKKGKKKEKKNFPCADEVEKYKP
jgi:hypothetical protein